MVTKPDLLTIVDEVTGVATQRAFKRFRCRRCAHVFNDREWREACRAPWSDKGKSIIEKVVRAAKQEEAAQKLSQDRPTFLKELFKDVQVPKEPKQ